MFVNCYSVDRGITRFRALYKWMDILRQTPDVRESGVTIPELKFLRRWCDIAKSYSPEALFDYLAEGDFSKILQPGDSRKEAFIELYGVLQWSNKVNAAVPPAIEHVTAFPNAVKSIRRAYDMGVDLVAVSGTPEEHVVTQLGEYGVLDCFIGIFAQQAGKKSAALTTMMAGPGWESKKTPLLPNVKPQYDVLLMMGDAPKDYDEAKKANKDLTGNEDGPCRMFFIEVGRENTSWKLFNEEVMDKLVTNRWSRDHEIELAQRGLKNLDRVWDPRITPIDTFPQRA
jgi:phosphoglycolate phosphatase-like HAD superfamily hydrolase